MAGSTGQKAASIISFVAFVAVAILNAISANRSDNVIFVKLFANRTNTDVSKDFNVNITPSGYAFSIWGLIYLWQAAFLIYTIIAAFRETQPYVLSYKFFVAYPVSCVLNITWLAVFAREKATGSFVVIAFYWVALVAAVVFAYRDIETNRKEIQKESSRDLLILRVLVENGVMIITAWVTIATNLNVAIMLVYSSINLSQTAACSIALSVLLVILLTYFVLENFVYFETFRYTFIPWFVVLWALVAVLVKNYSSNLPETIYALVITIFISILLVVRIVLVIIRRPKPGYLLESSQMS